MVTTTFEVNVYTDLSVETEMLIISEASVRASGGDRKMVRTLVTEKQSQRRQAKRTQKL